MANWIEEYLRKRARACGQNPTALRWIHAGLKLCHTPRVLHSRRMLKQLRALERREHTHPGPHLLAIMTMVRGEDPYLHDWISFHLKQGLSHIYLYDNADSEQAAERTFRLLQPQILTHKTVSYIRWPDQPGCRIGCRQNSNRPINSIQEIAFADFHSRFSAQTDHYIKLDVDEFVFHAHGGRISDLLPLRGTHPIHGYNFGSSGQETFSPEPVWKRFVWREERPSHVKSICRSRDVYEFYHAHLAFEKPWLRVSASTLRSHRRNINAELRLHHYKLKSREEFIQRRIRMAGFTQGDFSLEDFEALDRACGAVQDDSLARLA